ncbi:unnamed protein product, partial [Mesorhabditis spiculigera]
MDVTSPDIETSISSPPESFSDDYTVDDPLMATFPLLQEQLLQVKGPYGHHPLQAVWSCSEIGAFAPARKILPLDSQLEENEPCSILSVTRGRDMGTAINSRSDNPTATPFQSVAYPVIRMTASVKKKAMTMMAEYTALGHHLKKATPLKASWALPNETPVMSVMFLFGQCYRENGEPVAKVRVPSVVFDLQKGNVTNQNDVLKNKCNPLKAVLDYEHKYTSSGYSTSPSVNTALRCVHEVEERVEAGRKLAPSDVADMFREFYGESEGSDVSLLEEPHHYHYATHRTPVDSMETKSTDVPIHRLHDFKKAGQNIAAGGDRPETPHLLHHAHHYHNYGHHNHHMHPHGTPSPSNSSYTPATPIANHLTGPAIQWDLEEVLTDFPKQLKDSANNQFATVQRPLPLLDGLSIGNGPLLSTKIATTSHDLTIESGSLDDSVFYRPAHDVEKQLDGRESDPDLSGSPTSVPLSIGGSQIAVSSESLVFEDDGMPAIVESSLRSMALIPIRSSCGEASADHLGLSPLMGEQQEELTRTANPVEVDFMARPERLSSDTGFCSPYNSQPSITSTFFNSNACSSWNSKVSTGFAGIRPAVTTSVDSVEARSLTRTSESDTFQTITLDEHTHSMHIMSSRSDPVVYTLADLDVVDRKQHIDKKSRSWLATGLFGCLLFRFIPMWIKHLACTRRRPRGISASTSRADTAGSARPDSSGESM